MEKESSSGNESIHKYVMPPESAVDETKAIKMKRAIQEIFESNGVNLDPKLLLAIAYSTDAPD